MRKYITKDSIILRVGIISYKLVIVKHLTCFYKKQKTAE